MIYQEFISNNLFQICWFLENQSTFIILHFSCYLEYLIFIFADIQFTSLQILVWNFFFFILCKLIFPFFLIYFFHLLIFSVFLSIVFIRASMFCLQFLNIVSFFLHFVYLYVQLFLLFYLFNFICIVLFYLHFDLLMYS